MARKQQQLDPAALAAAQKQREEQEVAAAFQKGITALRDFIAPSSIELNPSYFRLGTRLARTYYIYGYPRQLYTGWLSPMINLDEVMDISLYVYPVESQVVMENLRKKVTQLEAGLQLNAEKGKVRDPGMQAAIMDAEEMRDKLQVGEERFFRFGFYFTISVPIIMLRSASSLTVNDLPAPDLAKTTELPFSKEKRSKITSPELCMLMPYRMPLSWLRSAEVNGKLVEMAPVDMLRRICSWSENCGTLLLSPCSCCELAGLEKISCWPSKDSILWLTNSSSSIAEA